MQDETGTPTPPPAIRRKREKRPKPKTGGNKYPTVGFRPPTEEWAEFVALCEEILTVPTQELRRVMVKRIKELRREKTFREEEDAKYACDLAEKGIKEKRKRKPQKEEAVE